MPRRTVLLVSKALTPPWNDSSKNLARDVAAGLTRHTPVVLTRQQSGWRPPQGRWVPLYPRSSAFAAGSRGQLAVLRHLASGPSESLWHFFFAPNPRTSYVSQALATLRRAPTVQTVCSRPLHLRRAPRLLFADHTVVLSRRTKVALMEAGVAPDRLSHVPPAVPPLVPPSEPERAQVRGALAIDSDAPVLLYPGDLELGDGATRIVEAFAAAPSAAILVMACRAKTSGAAAAERTLRTRISALGLEARVRWVGETRRIHRLIGASDVVALPSRDLYAKMDLPLVLLEAMWMARAVVVAAHTPAEELGDDGGALAIDSDEELRVQLRGLLDDGEARRRLGAAGRRAAEAHYRPERMVEAYEQIYDRILEPGR